MRTIIKLLTAMGGTNASPGGAKSAILMADGTSGILMAGSGLNDILMAGN